MRAGIGRGQDAERGRRHPRHRPHRRGVPGCRQPGQHAVHLLTGIVDVSGLDAATGRAIGPRVTMQPLQTLGARRLHRPSAPRNIPARMPRPSPPPTRSACRLPPPAANAPMVERQVEQGVAAAAALVPVDPKVKVDPEAEAARSTRRSTRKAAPDGPASTRAVDDGKSDKPRQGRQRSVGQGPQGPAPGNSGGTTGRKFRRKPRAGYRRSGATSGPAPSAPGPMAAAPPPTAPATPTAPAPPPSAPSGPAPAAPGPARRESTWPRRSRRQGCLRSRGVPGPGTTRSPACSTTSPEAAEASEAAEAAPEPGGLADLLSTAG